MNKGRVSLRVLIPGKGKRLMLVPWTPDGFRATVGAVRSLDGSNDVIFQTFSLPRDSSLLLLVKTLADKRLKKSSLRRWRLWRSVRREFCSTASAPWLVSLQYPPPNPAIYCVGSGGRKLEIRVLNEICGLRVSVQVRIASKSTLSTSTANASAMRSGSVIMHPAVLILVSSPLGGMLYLRAAT